MKRMFSLLQSSEDGQKLSSSTLMMECAPVGGSPALSVLSHEIDLADL